MKLIIDIPDEYYKFFQDLQYYSSGRRSGRTIERNVINAIKNGTPYNPTGDCISREALKEHKVYSKERHEYVVPVYNIDNAQAVEPFTQLEKEEIADAINYLLGAELLEENGYTEEVINALKSALKKVGGAE